MYTIYVFSGLGVDERVFFEIDFYGHPVQYIHWIRPLENESLTSYAKRIKYQITEPNPILIGLSFGGMIATEVSKLIVFEQLILLATAKNKSEIPFLYRLAGKLKLTKLIPVNVLKKANVITYWFLGTQNEKDKELLKNILDDTDTQFLKWAIHQITQWENIDLPIKYFHIHGTTDRILPISKINCQYKLLGGGHFMTITQTVSINQILKGLLK